MKVKYLIYLVLIVVLGLVFLFTPLLDNWFVFTATTLGAYFIIEIVSAVRYRLFARRQEKIRSIYQTMVKMNSQDIVLIKKALGEQLRLNLELSSSELRTSEQYKELLKLLKEKNSSLGVFAKDRLATLIDDIEFPKGFFHYSVSNKMKVGVTEKVSAEIFVDETPIDGIADKSKVREISVDKSMKVKLIGDKQAFDIVVEGTEEQSILRHGKTTWKWSVKPLKSGNYDLEFVVTIVLKMSDSRMSSKDLETHKEVVVVKINVPYSTKEWFKKNWQWITGTIFGSGVIFALLKAFGVIK